MMTKMPEPVGAHPRPFAKLPTMHSVVNQKVRDIPDNQAARGSASNIDTPKGCEQRKEERKADDADPNRRSIEAAWVRVMHLMELFDESYLVVEETMQQVFRKRP